MRGRPPKDNSLNGEVHRGQDRRLGWWLGDVVAPTGLPACHTGKVLGTGEGPEFRGARAGRGLYIVSFQFSLQWG